MKKVGETTRSQSDFLEGQKGPYGRSPKKPTVGFEDDLPWVVSTTYRRSLFYPPEGGAFPPSADGSQIPSFSPKNTPDRQNLTTSTSLKPFLW